MHRYLLILSIISCLYADNALKRSTVLQDSNILELSNFIYRVFNQINIINSKNTSSSDDDNFIPSYLKSF